MISSAIFKKPGTALATGGAAIEETTFFGHVFFGAMFFGPRFFG